MSKEDFSRTPEELQPVEVIHRANITISELFGQSVPQHAYLREGGAEYAWFSQQQLSVSAFKYPNGSQEIVIFGSEIKGEKISPLLYFTSPAKKSFGFDRKDTHKDWWDLFHKTDPETEARLRGHRMIPGWPIFEACKDVLWEAIDQFLRQAIETHEFTPVMRFLIGVDGNVTWLFDQPTTGYSLAKAQYSQEIGADIPEIAPAEFIPALGVILGFSFAPEITTQWEGRLNYMMHEAGDTQVMGATQALPLALARRDEFF